jgi:hypothetical protein
MNPARGRCGEAVEHNLSHDSTSRLMSEGVVLDAIFRTADRPKKEALAKGCFFPPVALY